MAHLCILCNGQGCLEKCAQNHCRWEGKFIETALTEVQKMLMNITLGTAFPLLRIYFEEISKSRIQRMFIAVLLKHDNSPP